MSLLTQLQDILGPCAAGGAWPLQNTSEQFAKAPDGSIAPFIVWQRIVSTDNVTLVGPSGLQNTRIQVDIYAPRLGDAEGVRKAVDAALLSSSLTFIPLSSQDLIEPAVKLVRIVREYSVWYDESVIERLFIGANTGRILDAQGLHVSLRGWNNFRYGAWQPGDAAEDAAAGATFVRLGDRWAGNYTMAGADSYDPNSPQTGYTLQANLDMYDAMVDEYEAAGIWIGFEFDSNFLQGNPGGTYFGIPNSNATNNPQLLAQWVAHRQFLINRYRKRNRIAYWGVLVEPLTTGFSGDINILKAWQAQRIAEAREVDPDTPVAIGAFSYLPANIADVYDPSYDRVIYHANFLDDAFTGTDAGWTAKRNAVYNFRKTTKQAVIADQAGDKTINDPDCSILTTRFGDLNAHYIDWACWEKHGPRSSSGPDEYGSDYTDPNTGLVVRKQATYDAVTAMFRD